MTSLPAQPDVTQIESASPGVGSGIKRRSLLKGGILAGGAALSGAAWGGIDAPSALAAPLTAGGAHDVSTAAAPMVDGWATRSEILITNHDFQSDLTGWKAAGPDQGVTQLKVVRIGGTPTLRVMPSGSRPKNPYAPEAESSPFPVIADHGYTALARVYVVKAAARLGLRFFDGAGATLSTVYPAPSQSEVIDMVAPSGSATPATPGAAVWVNRSVSAKAPAGAVTAAVVLGTVNDGIAYFDDVMATADLTILGPALRSTSLLGMACGVDEQGRKVLWATATGNVNEHAHLVCVLLATGEVVKDLTIPGASGCWSVVVASDSTVYLGTFNVGHLYRYTPGDASVTDLGHPAPVYADASFVWSMAAGPHGSILIGTYPKGLVFRYSPGSGFTQVGPALGVVAQGQTSRQYIRSIAYDPTLDLIYAGTGAHAEIMAYPGNATAATVGTPLLPAEYASYSFAYHLHAENGMLSVLLLDGGPTRLLFLKVTIAPDGTISSTLMKDEPTATNETTFYQGVAYFPTSDLRLFRYDVATNTSTDMQSFAPVTQYWSMVQLDDQQNFPGDTLVGTTMMPGGLVLNRYNLSTKTLSSLPMTGLPKLPARFNDIITHSNGSIYSSGFFVGGVSAYPPMRFDKLMDMDNSKGFGRQSEGMAELDGKLYLGNYPGAWIDVYDPARTLAPGQNPRTVGQVVTPPELQSPQDRPYAMLGVGGKLYLGTVPEPGKLIGALSIFDPATGSTIVKPNIVSNQSLVSMEHVNGVIYAGSSTWGGLGVTPDLSLDAKLLAYDIASDQATVHDLPATGARTLSGLTLGPDGLLWCLAMNRLMAFDPASKTWVLSRTVLPDLAQPDDYAIPAFFSRLVTSGTKIYGALYNRYLFAIDPSDASVEVLYRGKVMFIAKDHYGNIYTSFDATNLMRLCVSAAATTGPNLLRNPGFDTVGPDGAPVGWAPIDAVSRPGISIVSTPVRSGTTALKLTRAPGKLAVGTRSETSPARAGMIYNASAWIWVEGDAELTLEFLDANGARIGVPAAPMQKLSGTNRWVRATVSGAAPANAVAMRVMVYLRTNSQAATAYVDDAQLSAGALPLVP